MINDLRSTIEHKFKDLYKEEPLLVAAPGRINLLGEHTDYNEGFVLPAAINKYICFAISKSHFSGFRFYSIDYDEFFEANEIEANYSYFPWAGYLLGVIAQFKKLDKNISGINCVFGGDIPIGAGLSSSAALGCGFAYGIANIFDLKISKSEIARIAQKAEHEFAGVLCGIMDQYASVMGKKDSVFKLDCRNLDYKYYPLVMEEHEIVLVNTMVEHELASSEYNIRRKECNQGVEILSNSNNQIKSLRDVTIAILEEHKNAIPENIYNRCKYVVEENLRVNKAGNMLLQQNFSSFGQLMYSTHDGLRNLYKVSCNELDILVDITKNLDYVLGSRMMGGGFGGCTINLVREDKIPNFKEEIISNYTKLTKIKPEIYLVELSNGVNII